MSVGSDAGKSEIVMQFVKSSIVAADIRLCIT